MQILVTVILTALQAVEALLTSTGVGSAAIDNVLSLLVKIIPLIGQEYATVVPYIKNIIAALKNDPTATAAQLAQLAELDAQADQAFEAAAAAADAADATAAGKPASGATS